MKTAAVTTEYNPFHNGHAFHIRQTRSITRAENVIAVMSGNFVQRGGCAILDKFSRARAALSNGADIVIELPVFFASASAEIFARGAVSLIDSINIVNFLSFGAENPDIRRLNAAAEFYASESCEFCNKLKGGLREGKSFARARAESAGEFALNAPNDILAVEYIKALKRLNSGVSPIAVGRSVSHDSLVPGEYASASAVRRAALAGDWGFVGKYAPAETVESLKTGKPGDRADFGGILSYALLRRDKGSLAEIRGVTEGLENKIAAAARNVSGFNETASAIKSKRYALSAIRRALTDAILGITKEKAARFPTTAPYARILGFRRDKSTLIGELTRNSKIPIIIGAKNAEKILTNEALEMFNLDIFAADVYRAATGSPKNEYEIPIITV